MPYSLMRGGWLALAALLLIMPLFALSGQVCKLGWHCLCCRVMAAHMAVGPGAALLIRSQRLPSTPQLIVWAFDLMPVNVPKTYPELGRAAAGRWGVQAVMLFSFLGTP